MRTYWRSWGYTTIFLALFIFALYSNVTAAKDNYLINQRVNQAEQQTATLNNQVEKLTLLEGYYQSSSYQNVQARLQLGFKAPNETTVIIKGVPTPASSLDSQLDTQVQEQSPVPKPATNFQRWLHYLFG